MSRAVRHSPAGEFSLSGAVVSSLAIQLGVALSDAVSGRLVEHSRRLTWTRDPFDRVIVAHAAVDGARLVTADRTIRGESPIALW